MSAGATRCARSAGAPDPTWNEIDTAFVNGASGETTFQTAYFNPQERALSFDYLSQPFFNTLASPRPRARPRPRPF